MAVALRCCNSAAADGIAASTALSPRGTEWRPAPSSIRSVAFRPPTRCIECCGLRGCNSWLCGARIDAGIELRGEAIAGTAAGVNANRVDTGAGLEGTAATAVAGAAERGCDSFAFTGLLIGSLCVTGAGDGITALSLCERADGGGDSGIVAISAVSRWIRDLAAASSVSRSLEMRLLSLAGAASEKIAGATAGAATAAGAGTGAGAGAAAGSATAGSGK